MDNVRAPGDLLALWRERAAFLQQYGDPNSARLWQLAARELERALTAPGKSRNVLHQDRVRTSFLNEASHFEHELVPWIFVLTLESKRAEPLARCAAHQ
jgi:hypothetical protein